MMIEREHFKDMLESDVWTLHEFEINEPVVRLPSDDVAVIAYTVVLGDPFGRDRGANLPRSSGAIRRGLHNRSRRRRLERDQESTGRLVATEPVID
jgi:hypothetical protein